MPCLQLGDVINGHQVSQLCRICTEKSNQEAQRTEKLLINDNSKTEISCNTICWAALMRLSIEVTVVQSHLPPFRNLGNFIHLTLPVSFRRDTKSRWSLLSGVYARGNERSHTRGKCVTCSALTNSREGQFG